VQAKYTHDRAEVKTCTAHQESLEGDRLYLPVQDGKDPTSYLPVDRQGASGAKV
jgi:hypothetical protein